MRRHNRSGRLKRAADLDSRLRALLRRQSAGPRGL